MKDIILGKRGMAVISVYIIIVVLLIFIGAYLNRSFSDFNFAQRQRDEQKAYYIAEAGLNEVSMGIYQAFAASNEWRSSREINGFKLWFGEPDPPGGTGSAASRRATFLSHYPNLPTNVSLDAGRYSVILPSVAANPVIVGDDGALIKLIATGEAPSRGGTVRKIIAATISYDLTTSPVFNYAYFVNNNGWLLEHGVTLNGDVRANGNFSFDRNPIINGDIYTAVNPALGAAGTAIGNSRSYDLTQYSRSASDRARPMNPADPSDPQNTTYIGGYPGTSSRYEYLSVLDMPYLGNLDTYKRLARSKGGRITQGRNILVDNVYTGAGPDNIAGTPDDGTVLLIGTQARPIKINGPVVVDKDVIIKGVITGQGTIYSGRNVHIVGNITYSKPPDWPKPDATPQDTANTNKGKDFMGLVSKGNIIVGDYTSEEWKNACESYLKPPFTQGYATDATDASLGYDTDKNPLNGYWFDGDYTTNDGGFKNDGTDRKFYESSLRDVDFKNLTNPTNHIRTVDAVIYNDHAFSGRVGIFTLNGSIVCRDEAVVYSGSIDINYDMRATTLGNEYKDIYLPRDLALPNIKSRQGN